MILLSVHVIDTLVHKSVRAFTSNTFSCVNVPDVFQSGSSVQSFTFTASTTCSREGPRDVVRNMVKQSKHSPVKKCHTCDEVLHTCFETKPFDDLDGLDIMFLVQRGPHGCLHVALGSYRSCATQRRDAALPREAQACGARLAGAGPPFVLEHALCASFWVDRMIDWKQGSRTVRCHALARVSGCPKRSI